MFRRVPVSEVSPRLDVEQQLGQHGPRMSELQNQRLPAQAEALAETGGPRQVRLEQSSSPRAL